jgi:putative transposase
MIEPSHPKLPIVRQCELLGLARASYYRRPEPEPDENLRLMRVEPNTFDAKNGVIIRAGSVLPLE